MNLRAACAELGAVQPKGHVSFSEAGRGWNVRWRATSQAQNPVKSPRQDFSIFLTPVRVAQCRAGRVQESATVNLAAAEVVIDSSAASCCGTPSAATPGSALSAASISTRRSSCDVLPHEFLQTQKGLHIDREGHRRLKSSGLVEGRYPNLTVAGSVARATGNAGRHIRERGFDNQYYLDMKQKRAKISNLLQYLRMSGKVVNQGTRSRPAWVARGPASGKGPS